MDSAVREKLVELYEQENGGNADGITTSEMVVTLLELLFGEIEDLKDRSHNVH